MRSQRARDLPTKLDQILDETPVSRIIPLDRWTRELGKTPATIWRWRRRGLIVVQNLAGRLYISREGIARFEGRVAAGEFAKVHKTPARKEEVNQ
jgi:hypothetical protein